MTAEEFDDVTLNGIENIEEATGLHEPEPYEGYEIYQIYAKMSVVKDDITKIECDCIVNAANPTLLGGGGVDGAIHRAAGPLLREECRQLGGCKTGEAKITGAYRLPAKYVIHTVGPIYSGVCEDRLYLWLCYHQCLDLAMENHLHTIAFPAISTGAYRYPIEEAARVAVSAVADWLKQNKRYDMRIIFACYNDKVYEWFNFWVNRGIHCT